MRLLMTLFALIMTPVNNPNDSCSVIGMPKEKYDPPDPRRMYTIMSTEEATNGKKSYWAELEISGEYSQGVGIVLLNIHCSHTPFETGIEMNHIRLLCPL